MYVQSENMTSAYSMSPENEVCHSDPYYSTNTSYYTHLFPTDTQNSASHNAQEETYWDSTGSTDSPVNYGHNSSPINGHNSSNSPYETFQYTTHYCTQEQYEKNGYIYEETYHTPINANGTIAGPRVVRVTKRRNTANKKERRRTQSINSAYLLLREHIPNVPNDTKLSKIKTLRLAKTYISYLVGVLEGDQDPTVAFRPELVPSSRKINAERRALMKNEMQNYAGHERKKSKGRTGWPQDVWSMELKQTAVK